MANSVKLDPAAIEDLLNSPDGPVGLVIEELSEKAADIAKILVPVMKRRKWNPLYQYGPPGVTSASIRASGFRYNKLGQLYSGVNVNYGPTLFLQRPARQIHSPQYMFMSRALDIVTALG
ncbi:MAG TPA: hypothetical protein VGG75_14175 [Trebonia sp.]